MPRNPPPQIPVLSYPVPVITDFMVVDEWNTEDGSYQALEYGSRHPDTTKFPGYFLVKQQPSSADKWVTRVWVADPEAENTYNLQRQAFDGDSTSYPQYVRKYEVRRNNYTAGTMGSALTGVVSAKVTAGGSGYTTVPTVTPSGGGGAGATFKALIFRGEVVWIVVTAEGTGYTSAPTLAIAGGGGASATATAAIQPAAAVLVAEQVDRQEESPNDSAYVIVTRRYMTLPGVWLPTVRYEDRDLGVVQQRRRAVLATGQYASVTKTGKVYYEAYEGSAIVNWEIEDIYSDGTGSSTANTRYPVVGTPNYYDDERGAVSGYTQLKQSVLQVASASIYAGGTGGTSGTQTVTGTTGTGTKFQASVTVAGGAITAILSITVPGAYTTRPTNIAQEPVTGASLSGATLSLTMEPSEAGSLAATSTLATLTRYEQFNEFIVRQVVEKWVLPGPLITKSTPELKSGTIITETKQMKLASDITASISISTEQQIVVEKIPTAIGNLLAFEVKTTIPKGDHYSEATAILEEEYRPFSFPGRVDLEFTDPFEFLNSWRKGFTQVVSHLVYTWWVNSETKPTISIDGRFPETLAWTETTILDSVLHDAATINGIDVAATSPSYATYLGWIGTRKNVDGSVTATSKNRWQVQLIKVVMK